MNPRTAVAFALACSLSLLAACQRDTTSTKPGTGHYVVQPWALPAEAGSLAPDLSQTPDGRLLLGWINRREGRRNALQFASYSVDAGWQSQPRTIAVGRSLLANAADTPHLLATPDGALWVQWLQTRPDAPSGYDTMLARSRDGGMTWAQITRVNEDDTPAEHGFAALWPAAADAAGIAWLDGRAQGGEHGGAGASTEHASDAEHPAGGAMQLRANRFTLDMERGTDAVVAARTCDCCQTAVAMTASGPLLAWRGRDADDVRDIVVARLAQTGWSTPQPVHVDGWQVHACPLAGPALAASGTTAVVAWYSAAHDQPVVQLARSLDGGARFATPVVVASGPAVAGRVAVALDAQQVWVAWLREQGKGQVLELARYAPDLSRRLQTFTVATLATRGMASGYPRLVASHGSAWLVWTDVAGGTPHLKGAQITR